MELNKKYFDKAVDTFMARRSANAQTLENRRDEIARKIPAYMELEKELSKTSAKLAMLILKRPDSFEKDLRELERLNLEIQQKMNNLLTSNGYKTDYLDKIYTCKKCKDTGIYNSEWCECFHETIKNIASRELNSQSPMSLCSFDTFKLSYYSDKTDSNLGKSPREIMSENFGFCVKYAEDFHIPDNGILMTGKTGLGKTHLSLSIANIVIDKGYNVVYGSAPDLLRQIEKEHFGKVNDTDTLETLENAELLILDDLGAEFESQFYTAAVYNILNSRLNKRLPTIVNTNLTANELKQRYTDRIVSRLYSMRVLLFYGNDVRLMD